MDTSQLASLDERQCAHLEATDSPVAHAAAALVRAASDAYGDRTDLAAARAAPIHDAFAVASQLLDPGLVRMRRLPVDVETAGEPTTGRTVIDVDGRGGGTPNVDVAYPAATERFAPLLLATLAR